MTKKTNQDQYRKIRAEMVKKGVSNAQIAREEQVSPVFIYYVLSCKRAGYRIRRAIAKAVDLPVENLWPDTPLEQRRAA